MPTRRLPARAERARCPPRVGSHRLGRTRIPPHLIRRNAQFNRLMGATAWTSRTRTAPGLTLILRAGKRTSTPFKTCRPKKDAAAELRAGQRVVHSPILPPDRAAPAPSAVPQARAPGITAAESRSRTEARAEPLSQLLPALNILRRSVVDLKGSASNGGQPLRWLARWPRPHQHDDGRVLHAPYLRMTRQDPRSGCRQQQAKDSPCPASCPGRWP